MGVWLNCYGDDYERIMILFVVDVVVVVVRGVVKIQSRGQVAGSGW